MCAVSLGTMVQNSYHIFDAIQREKGDTSKYIEAFSRPIPYTVVSLCNEIEPTIQLETRPEQVLDRDDPVVGWLLLIAVRFECWAWS